MANQRSQGQSQSQGKDQGKGQAIGNGPDSIEGTTADGVEVSAELDDELAASDEDMGDDIQEAVSGDSQRTSEVGRKGGRH